jgi:hypothetical protein
LTPFVCRILLVALSALVCGCSPRLLLVNSVADQLASQGQADEDDLLLARDAAPFYLKLSESMLRETPAHLPLTEAVAAGFTQYAYAFVAFEAEKLQASDAQAAQALNERAARLYARAQRHAMTALSARHHNLLPALAEGHKAALRLSPDEVGLAYWGAAAWAARIALSKDQPEVVADLPSAVRLATLAWQVDPTHGRGALASLMGTLEAARPGGDLSQARRYFEQAAAAAQGLEPGIWVAKAEALAQPAGDRPAFETLLRQALATSPLRRDLNSELMRQRAIWLLATADDRF